MPLCRAGWVGRNPIAETSDNHFAPSHSGSCSTHKAMGHLEAKASWNRSEGRLITPNNIYMVAPWAQPLGFLTIFPLASTVATWLKIVWHVLGG